jgi:hypothetical protein
LARIARTADLLHATPSRWGLRPLSWPEGEGLVGGQPFGDGQVAVAVQEQGVDPLDDRGGGRIGFQDVQPHAEAGLGRI